MNSLSEVFRNLAENQWSGEVHVTSSQGHGTIIIREGNFLWAHRPIDRFVESLERFNWVKLPPPEVIKSNKTWEQFVSTLLTLNHENYRRLVKLLKVDRFELFFRMFFWRNVEINAQKSEIVIQDPVVLGFYTPKRLEILLTEAEKRLEEWPILQERVGSGKRIFVSQISLPELNQRELDAIDQALLQFEENHQKEISSRVPYSMEELEILKLCDGRNTVQDVVRASPDGEFLTLRRMRQLIKKGALRPKDEDATVNTVVASPHDVSFQTLKWAWAFALVLALVLVIFVPTRPQPQMALQRPVYQALTLYRMKNDRYPLTLTELVGEGLITAHDASRWDYNLIHRHRYSLVLKSL